MTIGKKGKTKCNVSGCPCIICDVFGCSSLRSAAIYPLARGICINIYIYLTKAFKFLSLVLRLCSTFSAYSPV